MSEQTPSAATPQPLNPSDERLWATLIHVGGIFFGFVPALIGYLVLRDRSPFVREHAATALNFQITAAIVQVANVVVGSVLGPLTLGLWHVVQFLIASAVVIVALVFSILAAVAANRGQRYRYPLSIPFVR